MRRFMYGLVALLVIGGTGVFIFARNDPLAELLNSKWLPISVDDQRGQAITSAARTLPLVPAPNVAVGIDVKTMEGIGESKLRALGVTKLRVKGEKQLLRIEADFVRMFEPKDLPEDFQFRELVEALRPEITGTIVASVGIASAPTDLPATRLQLRLLPAFNSLHVDKIRLAGKADVAPAGEAIAALLTRYSGNITGILNNLPVLDVLLPTSPFETADPTGPIKISIPSAPEAKLSLASKPITFPFHLAGLAWLIDNDRVTAIAQYLPMEESPPALPALPATFDLIRNEFFARLKAGLAISEPPGGAWLAVGKAFFATALNSAFAQASPCLSAQGPIPNQTFRNVSTTLRQPGVEFKL
jgi:hypothetical protein